MSQLPRNRALVVGLVCLVAALFLAIAWWH